MTRVPSSFFFKPRFHINEHVNKNNLKSDFVSAEISSFFSSTVIFVNPTRFKVFIIC
jgi:hypothetical protein